MGMYIGGIRQRVSVVWIVATIGYIVSEENIPKIGVHKILAERKDRAVVTLQTCDIALGRFATHLRNQLRYYSPLR